MRRGAAVHDAWRRLPYGQLIEGSNQAGRIPATWRSRTPTAGGSACCRVLCRCEGSVGLLLLRLGDPLLQLQLRSPLLLLRLGPRVVADPRTGLRGALMSAALLLVAPTTIAAASATTITAAASLALALALAFAAAPAAGGRGGGAARGGRTRGGSGGDECRRRGLLVRGTEAEFLDTEHVGGRLEGG
jgi:hypothetical protein